MRKLLVPVSVFAVLGVSALSGVAKAGPPPDPFASNNGIAVPNGANPPPFSGPYEFRQLSHNYPKTPPSHSWLDARPKGPITLANAADYMTRLKAYVEPTLRKMIEAPADWDPASSGWYDMPWMGEGDAESGRDAILGSFTGQIVLASSEAHKRLTEDTQNHTIIYYDPMAASTLGDIWKNIDKPSYAAANYREGSIVVKAGGIAATPKEWPDVDGAAIWRVFRPPPQQVISWYREGRPSGYNWTPEVTDLRVMQFDIIVKDSEAAPKTGWVFTTFVYDKTAPKGTGPWDQLVPLGATWGNDPEYDGHYTGHPPGKGGLTEFWHNPKAPEYTAATLGWGGRMSGPIDIAERHGVILLKPTPIQVAPGTLKSDDACLGLPHTTVSGPFRASGCMSCHGTSQSGLGARMYPSPLARVRLPMDGQTFCLYPPGSRSWASWYQDRSGREPQLLSTPAAPSAIVADTLLAIAKPQAATAPIPFVRFAAGARPVDLAAIKEALTQPTQGFDYDMLLMFAIGTAEQASKGFTLLPERQAVH
jgi:hypothetical protein